jgi:cytochrome c oxidase subunit II
MNFFPEYSNFSKGVDTAFMLILGISFFFLIGLTILIIVFVIRYHHKRHPKPVQMKDNYTLEIVWTIIPLILVMLMFYFGYIGYMPMRNAPEDAMIIKTEGRMWEWEFTYPNGKSSKDLYVPIDKPVKLEMTSVDVIHSLYIPAFRVKEDLVPGKQTMLWFIAKELGTYEVLCAEYCGLRHSYMISDAIVMTEEDFEAWMADYDTTYVEPEGLTLLKKNACTGCHSLDGTKLIGPTFKGLYKAQKTVVAGGKKKTIIADEAYLIKAIYDPNDEIVDGYSANLMQSYKNILSKEDIDKIIDFLKTVK